MKTNAQKRLEALARLLDTLHPEPVSISLTIHPGRSALSVDELRAKIEDNEFETLKKEFNIKSITIKEETHE